MRSRSRCTARSRRRSSRPRSSASTASWRTSARRRPSASSARLASARPRRSSARRRTRTSPAAARRSAPTRSWPRWPCGSSRRRSGPGSSSGRRSSRASSRSTSSARQTCSRPRWRPSSARRWARAWPGWQVTDCLVTMTDCGYASPATSAADFRRLTQLVLMTALERAGTWVCEPLADLSLEMPASTAQGVLAALGRLGGRVRGQFSANGLSRVQAVLPVGRVRSPAAPAARPVDGGGDPRVAPRRLPADRRQPAEAPSLGPEPARPRRVARVTREARVTAAGRPGGGHVSDQGSATRCQETAASVGTSSGVNSPLSMSITNQPSSALPGFERPRTWVPSGENANSVPFTSRPGPIDRRVLETVNGLERETGAGPHHPAAVRADRAHRPAPRRRRCARSRCPG